MISPRRVCAVLVTRGDVDLTEIRESILDAGIKTTAVYDNSKAGKDLQCFGRFVLDQRLDTAADHVFMQDDDLIAPIAELLAEYDPVADRDVVVANKPAAEEWRFLGCGAVFHRWLNRDGWVERFTEKYGQDEDFYRVADVAFLYQHAYRSVDLGYRDLPWGTAPNRMYHQPGHYDVRIRARERALALAEATA